VHTAQCINNEKLYKLVIKYYTASNIVGLNI
jgi:hypothetical protein